MRFDQLAEHQIRKAQAEGQLDDLQGSGNPLPAPGDGDFAAQAGFRIMAEAGALPREIALKKEIAAERDAFSRAETDADRKSAMSRLADLQMRLAIEEEARRKFYRTS